MTALHGKTIAAAFALLLATGAALAFGGGPAQAREGCAPGYFCTHASTFDTYRAGWRIHSLDGDRKTARYACDANGVHCRYTRAYYIDDDGNAASIPGRED